jgi:uncharacterized protein GlcG (DUF336 family)
MDNKALTQKIEEILDTIENLIPKYLEDPKDQLISDGNVAVCVIDKEGNVYGRLFGKDKIRSRKAYLVAWTKASQVWITGIATGLYEQKVFNNEIDDKIYGILKPDLIGWQGGLPVTLKSGNEISIGFSGFRGFIDVDIVNKAVELVDGK